MQEKKKINIEVGNHIRMVRERAGLTQEQFGELVSLGTKNVSDIERGVVGVAMSTLKRICEKLHVSSDTIVFGPRDRSDIQHLTEQMDSLRPEQLADVEKILHDLFQLIAHSER